jgi:hypothetical protein
MRQRRFVVPVLLVLTVLATGCAGKSSEAVSALSLPEGAAAASRPRLDGMWRGTFGQVMTGDSGEVKGDIVFEIDPDGTYKGSWNTHLVAGSRRASRMQMAGKVTDDASTVSFVDVASGSRMILRRDGNILYGVTTDPATKRVSVAVELHRAQPAPEAP